MTSNLTKKIEEIEDTKLKSGELFMYGHCETNGDINAGVCCEEADLEAIESTLQYIMLQTAKVLYESNPEITKEDVAEILFTDLFGSINLSCRISTVIRARMRFVTRLPIYLRTPSRNSISTEILSNFI